ncbi:hypothetical protein NYE56_20640 [Bacillus sp. FSL R5-0603]|uniref:hypothetical protein n=1 Tax=Bacillus sp. FSL R5-0603 TaxID=2975307 RepID=UPI0030FD4945
MASIKYGSLRVNHLRNSSGLFVGTNVQKGRKSETFINEGFGAIKGKHNKIKGNAGAVEKSS